MKYKLRGVLNVGVTKLLNLKGNIIKNRRRSKTEYMENHSEKCIVCGKSLGRNKKFCSQECRAKYLRNMRKCVVCGKEFWAPPSSEKETCSRECERENRIRNGKENPIYTETLGRAHIAAESSPNTAPVETHCNAKSWSILSPDGKRYEVNNLALWAREHEEEIPGTVKQFCDGIRGVKRTIEGKKERGAKQYKGWTLEGWEEENLARKDFPARKERKPRTKMSEEERLEKKRQREKERYKKKKEESPG